MNQYARPAWAWRPGELPSAEEFLTAFENEPDERTRQTILKNHGWRIQDAVHARRRAGRPVPDVTQRFFL
jgi:hypothetical protein